MAWAEGSRELSGLWPFTGTEGWNGRRAGEDATWLAALARNTVTAQDQVMDLHLLRDLSGLLGTIYSMRNENSGLTCCATAPAPGLSRSRLRKFRT